MKVHDFLSFIQNSFSNLAQGNYHSKEAFMINARIQELSFYCKRLSTPQIGFILNIATSLLTENECYLNIGVWEGYSLFAAAIDNQGKTVIGVDNFSEMYLEKGTSANNYHRRYGPTRENFYFAYNIFKGPNTFFFEVDWIDFLTNFTRYGEGRKIGAVFYDGNHTEDAHNNFFRLVLPHLSQECIIFIDDLRYDFVREASQRFLTCNPDFSILFQIEVDKPRHPAWWGGFQALTRTLK